MKNMVDLKNVLFYSEEMKAYTGELSKPQSQRNHRIMRGGESVLLEIAELEQEIYVLRRKMNSIKFDIRIEENRIRTMRECHCESCRNRTVVSDFIYEEGSCNNPIEVSDTETIHLENEDDE